MKPARMPFGRFKGSLLRELPDSYLCCLRDDCDLHEPLRMRIRPRDRRRRRAEAATAVVALPPALRATAVEIVNSGFRMLALKRHPDHGGSHEAMLKLQAAKEALERLAGGAA